MKRKLLKICTCLLLVFLFIPVNAFALGGYVVVKGLNGYHSAMCENLCDYNLKDAKWYKTVNDVKKTGLLAGPCCSDMGYDYEDDDASMWNSDDWKIDNILEIERMWGIIAGYDAGIEEGYEKGYEEGYTEAYDIGLVDGEKIGYASAQEDYEKNKGDKIYAYIGVAIAAFIIGSIFSGRKNAEELRILHAEKIKYEALLKIYQMDSK